MFYNLLILVSSFALFLKNVYGTVAPYRDSGDMAASAASLGIAHPPGYSLYVLITHLGMQILPLGNIAYRANVLSCLWASLTVVLLFQILRKISGAGPALLAAFVWLLMPSAQRLSIVSEMYSLHALFCAVIFYLLLERQSLAAMFVLGFSFYNHPTVVFMLPGILVMLWTASQEKGMEKIKPFLYYAAAAMLGLSLLLYYPLRSFQIPQINWGEPESLRNLWRLITRADYGGLKLHPEESAFAWTSSGIWDQIKLFMSAERRELGWAGIALILIGIVFQRSLGLKDWMWFCGVSFMLSGPLFFILSNLPVKEETTLPILEPYLLMANLFILPWLAVGAEKIKWAVWPLLIIMLILAVPEIPSRRHDFSAYDYGRNILKTMPLKSSLFEPDDTTAFVVSYFQTVEKRRVDIAVLLTLRTKWGYDQVMRKYPDLLPGMNFPNAPAFISALISMHQRTGRPLFADHPSKLSMANYNMGILSRAGDADIIKFEAAQAVLNFQAERGNIYIDREPEFFSRHLLARKSAALNNIGIAEQGFKNFRKAQSYLEEALVRDPRLPQGWINLGLNAYLQDDFKTAEKKWSEGLQRLPDHAQLKECLALVSGKNQNIR